MMMSRREGARKREGTYNGHHHRKDRGKGAFYLDLNNVQT
jgi:hypothetical protein